MNKINPLKENVICVLNPDGIKYVETFESSKVPVKQLVTPQRACELQEQGLFRDPIRENTIYIFHPLYDQFIIRTKEDDDKFIQRRINAIETIVSYLGGKNFKVLETHESRKEKKTDIKADVGVDVTQDLTKVNVGDDFSLEKNDSSQKDMEVYSGAEWEGKYSEKGFNEALRIAKEYGIDDDPDISFLLEQRSPEHPNPIQRKDYHVQLHSELSHYLHVANDLKVAVDNVITLTSVDVEVNVDVEKSSREETSETFDFSVEFGPVVIEPESIIIESSLENKKAQININTILIGVITVLVIAVVILLILFL